MALFNSDVQKFLSASDDDRQRFRSDSGSVGRASIDGTLVVYDLDDVPMWLVTVLEGRDDGGNTKLDKPRQAVG